MFPYSASVDSFIGAPQQLEKEHKMKHGAQICLQTLIDYYQMKKMRSTSASHSLSTTPRKSKEVGSGECTCSLPNKKYCMLMTKTKEQLEPADARSKNIVWVPMNINKVYSSSTPTAPYSTADILYNNEVSLSQKEDLRQSSFTDSEKNREPASRQKSKEIDTPDNRRPSSKSGSKKSLSIESVTFDREDSLKSSTLPPPKGTNHFRPNGIRNNVLKGEPLFSTRSSMTVSSSGREADDLIAMGSLWSPNQTSISLLSHHQSQSQSALHPGTQPPHHQRSSYTNTMSAGLVNISNSLSSKSLSLNTNSMQPPISTAPASMTLQRKLPSNGIKPIMVQNNLSGLRSIKEKKEEDAKYSDPLTGATTQFLQRVQELQALEGETIRWERTKKIKKKKQDRDS